MKITNLKRKINKLVDESFNRFFFAKQKEFKQKDYQYLFYMEVEPSETRFGIVSWNVFFDKANQEYGSILGTYLDIEKDGRLGEL